MRTRLKVCCIADIDEARTALAAGADALGLVSAMPSGPGPISEDRIAAIAAEVPTGTDTFLLTAEDEGAAIADQVARCGTTTVQIVRHVAAEAYAPLRARLPAVKVVQVVHVEDDSALAFARERAPLVDALLLDSGRPSAAVAELGGTGRAHDWAISRAIVAAVDVPVLLAGGLNPGNVGEAVAAVRPYGVDLCSGVRSDGRLDAAKLAAFVQALHAG
jgi:phosphoribosylanthranilate isomerase